MVDEVQEVALEGLPIDRLVEGPVYSSDKEGAEE